MKCPYCGEEMENGRIVTVRDICFLWLPEEQKMPFMAVLRNMEKKGGMILGQVVNGEKRLDFNLCRKCNIGISRL